MNQRKELGFLYRIFFYMNSLWSVSWSGPDGQSVEKTELRFENV